VSQKKCGVELYPITFSGFYRAAWNADAV